MSLPCEFFQKSINPIFMVPVISIVIPCYNCERYIRETLESVRKQTIDNWECIMVNDGSTDDSLVIMKSYEQADSRFFVIDKENEGPAIARNIAIGHAHAKYICPLDSDDIIAPTFAEKTVSYLDTHPDVKLVYSQCDFFGDMTGTFPLDEYRYDRLLWGNCIVCTSVYRKSDFERTVGYNPNMKLVYEDWDFYLSLLSPQDKVYCIPEVLFYYRVHGVSRNNNNKGMQVFYEAQRTIVKNHQDKYGQYMTDIIKYYNEAQGLEAVLNSLSFKVGKTLLAPFQWLKKWRK